MPQEFNRQTFVLKTFRDHDANLFLVLRDVTSGEQLLFKTTDELAAFLNRVHDFHKPVPLTSEAKSTHSFQKS
jgi:hypothetical protein